MARLYLHIGINKTGTSAIQQFLSARAPALAAARMLYPQTGRAGNAHYALSRALGFAHGRDAAQERIYQPLVEQLGAEMKSARCDVAVISSEDFVLRGDPALVRSAFEDFDCRIVVYLRRHDYWWLSAYNQAVRMVSSPPWQSGFAGYLKFARGRAWGSSNYRELVERWAQVFTPQCLIVRPYEPIQNEGGVVADFLRSVGLDGLAEVASGEPLRVNESTSPQTIALIEIVQRAQIPDSIRETLIKGLLEENTGERTAFPVRPRMRRRLIAENQADYEYIARTYMGRTDGVMFLEPPPEDDPDWEPAKTPDTIETVSRLITLLESRR